MAATPQFGGTNGVPSLNLGQPGSARAVTGPTARYTLHVIENPEQATVVPQKVPQQNVIFQDVLGFVSGSVEWRGTLSVDAVATWRAIAAELNQYLHGSGRTSGIFTYPAVNFLRSTKLTDAFGNVMSEAATLADWRSGPMRRITSGGTFNYGMELIVRFKLLG